MSFSRESFNKVLLRYTFIHTLASTKIVLHKKNEAWSRFSYLHMSARRRNIESWIFRQLANSATTAGPFSPWRSNFFPPGAHMTKQGTQICLLAWLPRAKSFRFSNRYAGYMMQIRTKARRGRRTGKVLYTKPIQCEHSSPTINGTQKKIHVQLLRFSVIRHHLSNGNIMPHSEEKGTVDATGQQQKMARSTGFISAKKEETRAEHLNWYG